VQKELTKEKRMRQESEEQLLDAREALTAEQEQAAAAAEASSAALKVIHFFSRGFAPIVWLCITRSVHAMAVQWQGQAPFIGASPPPMHPTEFQRNPASDIRAE
jgi:hypothetical protein